MDELVHKLSSILENEIDKCRIVIDKDSNTYILEIHGKDSITLTNNQVTRILVTFLCDRLNQVKDDLYLVNRLLYMMYLELIIDEEFKPELIDDNVVYLHELDAYIITREFMEISVFHKYRSLFLNSWWKYNRIYNVPKSSSKKHWYSRITNFIKFWK